MCAAGADRYSINRARVMLTSMPFNKKDESTKNRLVKSIKS
ncbi:hypothetical protein GPLA_0860 [Paraglaciecola polaris LMG 21857]|uniref:Uncharacterized protein n=1 Tax=Paraglaciecola polaris LMG 21857 TaxID=1129793 RepID=K6Z6F4_9ALTE|nr:hypothetical protein GPLA_0860 [Paraglaciecola polaris LMG 21857]